MPNHVIEVNRTTLSIEVNRRAGGIDVDAPRNVIEINVVGRAGPRGRPGELGAAASDVTFAPPVGMVAIDVQAAIEEVFADVGDVNAASLDRDAGLQVLLNAHIDDLDDAHDASAISVIAAGGIASTDVQAALVELDTEKVSAATLTEQVQDIVGAEIVAGTNVGVVYDDGAGTVTITVTTETIQDIVGALVAVSGLLTVNYDDAGNALTLGLTTEAVQDTVGAFLAGAGLLTATYDDAGNVETLSVTAEAIEDALNGVLIGGTHITVTYDDGANTFTFAVTGLAAGDLSDFAEAVQDVIGALASGGSALTMTYNDGANTWALDVNVDGSSIEVSGDALRVKVAGITKAMLAADVPLLPATLGRPKRSDAVIYHGVPGVVMSTQGTKAFSNGVRQYLFFVVEGAPITLDLYSIEVTTNVNPSNFGFGIFAATEDLQPTGPSLYDSGDVSCATLGNKTGAMAVTLPVGNYVLVGECNAAVSLRSLRGMPRGGMFTVAWTTNAFTIPARAIAYTTPRANEAWSTTGSQNTPPDYFVTFRISDPSA